MKRFLFIDFWITGHHLEFIMHLVKAKEMYEKKYAISFFFLLSPEILTHYPEIKNLNSVFLISKEKCKHYSHVNRMRASYILLQVTGEIAIQNKIDEVMFLYGNEVLPYALIKKFNYKFSFIFFQPPFREVPHTFVESIKKKLKESSYFFLVRGRPVVHAFILNDRSCVDIYNKKIGKNKFLLLNDPVLSIPDYRLHRFEEKTNARLVFGHLGSLDHRKGTLKFLEAIGKLAQEYISKSTFIIAGNATDNFHKIILAEIEKLKEKDDNISIQYIPGFVDDVLFNKLFLQCDSIVLPYSNPQASSGLVGKAILFGKHLICPNAGLLGEIVSNYGYYSLFNKPDELAWCIKSFVDKKYGKINEVFRSDYIEKSNPEQFVRTLIFH